MQKKCWKTCVREFCYCKPCLNRKILCIRDSLDEVCRILNSGLCQDCDGKRRDRRK